MKGRGKFKFIELRTREAGSFKNSNGEVINYPVAYILKLNEKTDRGIEEISFKIDKDSVLLTDLKDYKEYTDIIIDFDIIPTNNNFRIVPTAINSK